MTIDPQDGDFAGAKIALLCGDQLLVYLRDDRADLPHPNRWDLPGGGREGDETPIACALRELHEEFSLRLEPHRAHWGRAYRTGETAHWFFVAHIESELIDQIVFGDEGQEWRLMSVDEFLAHDQAVAYLQSRLAEYFASRETERE